MHHERHAPTVGTELLDHGNESNEFNRQRHDRGLLTILTLSE